MFDMESNNFDKQIREKLQNLEANYKPEDWELMEQKLNGAEVDANPEFEDVILDGIAYGTLENYKADFNPTHWELMEQKLDDNYYPFRNKLYKYKVAEVGLMLLALFTLIQFLPFKKQNKTSEIVSIEQLSFGNDISNSNRTKENQKNAFELITPNESFATSVETLGTDDITAINYTENPYGADENVRLTIKDESLGQSNVLEIPIFETNQFPKKPLDLSIANRFIQNDAIAYEPISILSPINTYKPETLNNSNISSNWTKCVSCNPISSSILVSIGMMGGADADYITTPFDEKHYQKEYGQIAMGYSGGVTLGIKYHKWELETGAIYAAKYYGSRNVFEVNGSFEEGGYVKEGLQGVQLDIVKVPLHLRYNFMDRSKWNIYAHSGASFNMTVETLYEYTSHNIGNTNALGRKPDPRSIPTDDGVFEGGDLIDNTFITANLGLGIERHFNSRMSIFLGSTYQHQITKGLGPQNDKINSLSIMTGARVTLKPKKKN